jgi:hypothetical protein
MTNFGIPICTALSLAVTSPIALAQPLPGTAVPVTVDYYNRAQFGANADDVDPVRHLIGTALV